MDAKNLEALTLGPELMLRRFVNLPDRSRPEALRAAVDDFRAAYGELVPDLSVDGYGFFSGVFKSAWQARTEQDKQKISLYLTTIFEWAIDADKGALGGVMEAAVLKLNRPHMMRPGFVADFSSGQITIKPRTLLDWLVKSLLEYRDKLAICQRHGCPHPYYVKTHTRQLFCSEECANVIRQEKKERWWKANRGRFIKKWRRQRKAQKSKLRKRKEKRHGTLSARRQVVV